MKRSKRPLSKRQARKALARERAAAGRGDGFEPIINERHPHGNRTARRAAMSSKGGAVWKRRQRAWGERNARRRMRQRGEVTLRTLSVVDPFAVMPAACTFKGNGNTRRPRMIPKPVEPLARELADARSRFTHPSHTKTAKGARAAR
jgi:hypothetical protein